MCWPWTYWNRASSWVRMTGLGITTLTLTLSSVLTFDHVLQWRTSVPICHSDRGRWRDVMGFSESSHRCCLLVVALPGARGLWASVHLLCYCVYLLLFYTDTFPSSLELYKYRASLVPCCFKSQCFFRLDNLCLCDSFKEPFASRSAIGCQGNRSFTLRAASRLSSTLVWTHITGWGLIRLLAAAKDRGIAVPVDLELQVNNLFTKSQMVMKHTKQWLSAGKHRRDSLVTMVSRDNRSIIEGLQVGDVTSAILMEFLFNEGRRRTSKRKH